MKVLITGGAGYLGLNIIHYLDPVFKPGNLNPNEVIVLDPRDIPEGYLNSFGMTLHDQIKIQFVKGDICNFEEVNRLAEQIDVIFHLAFVVGGPACKNEPDKASRLATVGTENVVKAAQGKMIIFSSSDAVYGNEANGLCDENTPCNPATLYGKLKLQCEEMVKQSPKYCILRIPSNFGPSAAMRWGNLVHYIFKQMYEHGKISISDPQVTRTLIDVRDTARAFSFVLDNQEKFFGKILNIASGAWTKKEIAETIDRIIGGGTVAYDQAFTDPDARDFILDCSAIKEMGWYPKFSLEDGIRCLQANIESVSKGGKTMAIKGVIHRRAKLAHEDDRRFLFSIFNDDLGDFRAAQLKWFEFKKDSWVGKHYHEFAEIFCIIEGSGVYELVNVDHPEQREIFRMRRGDLVLVPKRTAHRALVKKDSVIIAANSEPYISPEESDFSFDFDTGLSEDERQRRIYGDYTSDLWDWQTNHMVIS